MPSALATSTTPLFPGPCRRSNAPPPSRMRSRGPPPPPGSPTPALWGGRALAVGGRLLTRPVAPAGRGPRRPRRLDPGEVVGGEPQPERPQRLREPVAPARARERHDVVPARQRPG